MNVIPSAGSRFGAVAQLGARLNRTQKVRGSNPLSSTKRLTMEDTESNSVSSMNFCSGFLVAFVLELP
jgi:hypothetical protein